MNQNHAAERIAALEPSKRGQIGRDYISGKPIKEIAKEYGIEQSAVQRIVWEDRLSTTRSKFAKIVRDEARKAGRARAIFEIIEQAEYEAAKTSVKSMMEDLFREAVDMFHSRLGDDDFLPKSPEGMLNAIQKIADTHGRINDDGDLKPTAIEIAITGVNPALALPPRAAVTVELIETGTADCPSPESKSTGSSQKSTSPQPEIESSSVDAE